MASLVYDSAHFNHTIDKVAKWMATSDSQVCLFADDTSVSILSSTTPSTSSVGEQGRQVLIDRLKCDAVSRIRSLFRSTAHQENNHNESKKREQGVCGSTSSSDASPNRNQNNRHGASESEHRRKGHTDSRHRRQSQPANGHSVTRSATRAVVEPLKESGDGSGGGGGFKEDKYLERIVDRATQEIRSAIYKLSAENKLPERCHLKMKLSIKPHRTSGGANSSPKESPTELRQPQRRQRNTGEDERRRGANSGRHRTSDREAGGRSERDKRAASSSNRHDHHDQKKDRRK